MNITGLARRLGFQIVKHSPKILTALGITCYAGAIITTVKSSRKIEERLAFDTEKLNALKADLNNKEAINMGEVVVKDTKREMLKTSLHAVGTTIKVYLPTIILFSAGTCCIIGANNIMYRRQAALTAAYSALNTSFAQYRQRVAEKYGPEEERALRQGAKVVKDKKTGEVTYVQEEPVAYDWGVVFDETCRAWQPGCDLSVQVSYVKYIRSYLQQRLENEGHLFLIDVYRELGINLSHLDDRQLQGAHVVGWIYDPNDPNRQNWISFGLEDKLNPDANGENYYKCLREGKNCLWIELNPDGDILTGDNGKETFMDYLKGKK